MTLSSASRAWIRPWPFALLVVGFLIRAAPIGRAAETLAPVSLRGYGTLCATFSQPAQPAGASVLEIACESVAKAQLVQAKYLSDLGLLPGVTTGTCAAAGNPVACRIIAGQGAIAAVREGARVVVLTAATTDDLAALCTARFPAAQPAPVSQPEVGVPMYLDRWDRFGFRFYSRPWETPVGQSYTYNIAPEFDYAAAHGTGFVCWDPANTVLTAQGLMNHSWFDWVQQAAREKGLPVAINAQAGASGEQNWLQDLYREQEQQKMPQYCGTYYSIASTHVGASGAISWNADKAGDLELGVIQRSLRHFAAEPNVVSFMEPHQELTHGLHDIFMEYGPVADRTYRAYLRQQYKTLPALGARWFGDAAHFRDWNEVRVPELAEFLGWGPQAIDLSGAWRVGYEKGATPAAWYQDDFDDSGWPTVVTGHDRTFFLPRGAAVYRRTLEVPAAWRAAQRSVWLYVWDLNQKVKDTVPVYVNGQQVGQSAIDWQPHWCAFDVSKALRDGTNHVALRLPTARLSYRVYLSPDAPLQYPNLGAGRNARWVDFVDWNQWSRTEAARRGIEMIRQVAPNHQITLAHPDEFSEGLKKLAEDYGGEFHNTGYMCDWLADYNPLLMQGAGLPFSAEPDHPAHGAGPRGVWEFKSMMGRWFSEGVQGIDYYMSIGDVLWDPQIKSHFEAIQNLVHLVGKYHAPPAQMALLYSSRNAALTGFPWGSDPNVNLEGGYWWWNIGVVLRDRCPFDAIMECDFARGAAAKYKVIVDSNTSIMDEGLVSEIENYVRAGGTFIAFVQTGRHTPTQKDAWPISRLTGYNVIGNARFNTGSPMHYGDWDDRALADDQWHDLKPAPGQSVFAAADWQPPVRANGLTLQKAAPDCQDLLLWEDGSVAVGMRSLGKGCIIEVGAKFAARRMWERIAPPDGYTPGLQHLARLFGRLLDWRGIAPTPAHLAGNGTPQGWIMLRHWVSNNGLYDVWTLWNQAGKTLSTDLVFDNGLAPTSAIDVETGKSLPVTAGAGGPRLAGLQLDMLQTRVILTPRNRLAEAGLDWLKLQRSWWRGTTPVPATPLPDPPHNRTLDLVDDWAFKPLEAAGDWKTMPLEATYANAPMAAPGVDDSSWERMRLGVWNFPNHHDVHHAMFRKRFTVPAAWTNGRVDLWLSDSLIVFPQDLANVWLDGKLIKDRRRHASSDAIHGDDVGGVLTAGSAHVLAVEIAGQLSVNGTRGSCWLAYRPKPGASLDLAGDWNPTQDALRYDATIHLPGDYQALALRRHMDVGRQYAGQNAVLSVDAANNGMIGVLINGRYESGFRTTLGDRWSLNVTPWVHFGGDNEIELIGSGFAPGKGTVRAVSLDFYDAQIYP